MWLFDVLRFSADVPGAAPPEAVRRRAWRRVGWDESLVFGLETFEGVVVIEVGVAASFGGRVAVKACAVACE